jgi:succinoglycan biosynthesis protein ExoV
LTATSILNFRTTPGNFGDDLNDVFMRNLFGEGTIAPFYQLDPPDDVRATSTLVLCIGTILNRRVPSVPRKLVIGAGAGYGPLPEADDRWTFEFVRGPHTAAALGLPAAAAITDPALILDDFVALSRAPTHRFGYMPHHATANPAWRRLIDDLDMLYIDPRRPIDEVVADLGAVEVLITEAMHGAIVAETMRLPWIPVTSAGKINSFKWTDWCASLDLSYAPSRLFGLWRGGTGWRSRAKVLANRQLLRRLCRRARPQLAGAALFEARRAQLREAFASVVDRWARATSLPREKGSAT